MRTIQDALEMLGGDPEGERSRARALSELTLAFTSLWSRLPHLALDLGPDGLAWNGAVVLTWAEDDVGLASTLRRSGIRQIAFGPGVETAEMPRLLEVMDQQRRLDADGELDLVTMLFREDFQHIRYTVGPEPPTDSVPTTPASTIAGLGAPVDGGALTTLPAETESASGTVVVPDDNARVVREAVREDARTTDRTRGVVELEQFDSTLYFLDQKEIEYLRLAIDREYAQDHAQSVLAMLLDVLQLRAEPRVRGEVIRILTTLMPYLLGTGRFESVAYLTAEIRTLTRSHDFEPGHRDQLDALRVSVSETQALAQLFHALDTGEVESNPENLVILLRELRPEALETVLVWVGQLSSATAKGSLVEAIEAFFTESPTTLGRMLDASDRTVVHRALGLASKLRLPELVDSAVAALESDDSTTRMLAARALSSIGTGRALRSVATMMDDPDPAMRRLVFEALAARPFKGAIKRLVGAIDSKDLESRDLSERRVLFEAYAAVAGASGVDTLEPFLLGKRGFGRRPSPETRACAAVALGAIGTPAARFALEKGANDRDPLVRSASGAALRGEG